MQPSARRCGPAPSAVAPLALASTRAPLGRPVSQVARARWWRRDPGISVGIDLGTTYSAVAWVRPDGLPELIPASPGADDPRLVPSVVAVDAEGSLLVGHEALEACSNAPDAAVRSSKRLMGATFEDARAAGGRVVPAPADAGGYGFVGAESLGALGLSLSPADVALLDEAAARDGPGSLAGELDAALGVASGRRRGKGVARRHLPLAAAVSVRRVETAAGPGRGGREEGRPRSRPGAGRPGEHVTLLPQDAAAAILSHLKAAAEAHAGRPVTRAVVSVPARFGASAARATEEAARAAGFSKVSLLKEPVAAALANGVGVASVAAEGDGEGGGPAATDSLRPDSPAAAPAPEGAILVLDLGGGTLDVSVVGYEPGTMEVLASDGDPRLGGDDWDAAISDWVAVKHLGRKEGGGWRESEPALAAALDEAAERAKRALSYVPEAIVWLDRAEDLYGVPLAGDELGEERVTPPPLPLALGAEEARADREPAEPSTLRLLTKASGPILTRPRLESLTKALFRRAREPLDRAAWTAGLDLVVASDSVLRGGEGNRRRRGGRGKLSAGQKRGLAAREAPRSLALPRRAGEGGAEGPRASARGGVEGEGGRAGTRAGRARGPRGSGGARRPPPDGEGDVETPARAITHVLLVGGASRMPGWVRFVRNMTGLPVLGSSSSPDTAVALGAAVMAAMNDGAAVRGGVVGAVPGAETPAEGEGLAASFAGVFRRVTGIVRRALPASPPTPGPARPTSLPAPSPPPPTAFVLDEWRAAFARALASVIERRDEERRWLERAGASLDPGEAALEGLRPGEAHEAGLRDRAGATGGGAEGIGASRASPGPPLPPRPPLPRSQILRDHAEMLRRLRLSESDLDAVTALAAAESDGE